MGDRAVLTLKSMPEVSLYLHWRGNLKDVQKILDGCRVKGYRLPEDDPLYAFAGLVKAAQDLMDYNGLSVGIGLTTQLDCDNGDNGHYIIGPDWSIAERRHVPE